MKAKSVFEFNSYKAYMAYMLSTKDRRGQITRASEALNCQRSYLSRVISESLHLTPDHAFKLGLFWNMPTDDRDYFQALVDFERAGDPEYRAHLKQRIVDMKRKNDSVQERAARTDFSVDALQVNYFSSWICSAIHFLTSIPEYQSIEAIGNRLGVKSGIIMRFLVQLQAQGFVAKNGQRWVYKSGEFHAPKNSPLVVLHHQNWRNRAVQDAQDFDNSSSVHFTAVQTVSFDDFERIKGLILQFISDASQIAGPSTPEEGLVLTCDLFKI